MAVARTIAIEPRLLLFDGPIGAFGPEITVELLKVIEELKKEATTSSLVTHEIGFARHMADRVAFFTNRIADHAPAAKFFSTPQTLKCHGLHRPHAALLTRLSRTVSHGTEAEMAGGRYSARGHLRRSCL